jgi:hypothetical protein
MTGQNEITDYRDSRKMQTRFAVGGATRKDTNRLSHQPVDRFFSNKSLASSFHVQHNFSNQLLYAQGYRKLSLPKIMAQSPDGRPEKSQTIERPFRKSLIRKPSNYQIQRSVLHSDLYKKERQPKEEFDFTGEASLVNFNRSLPLSD